MDQPRDVVSLFNNDPKGEAPAGAGAGFAATPGYRSDTHAVIIGIDHYEDGRIPDLRYARADAEAVHTVLTDPSLGRFLPANVTLLLDEQATEREIKTALGTDLPARAGAEDTVLVYFAGHGAPVIHPRGGSVDGMEKYLVPTDAKLHNLRATAIPMEAVQKWFGWIESKQVLFFLDSCYSGVAGGRTFERPDYQPRAPLTDEFLEHLGGEGRFVITACDVNEVSLESPELGHGLFTYYLMEGLRGAADQGGDGLVTVQELYEYVHENVVKHARKLGGSMHPIQKGSVRGRVFLTRYETEAQRRGRVLLGEAAAQEQAGNLEKAMQMYVQAMQVQPTDQAAHQATERIQKRLHEEELTRRNHLHHIETVLYTHYERAMLPLQEFSIAMEVVNKKPADLTEVERRIRHWIELLSEGKISPQLYIRSIEQARKQPVPQLVIPESKKLAQEVRAQLVGPAPLETTADSKGGAMSAEVAVPPRKSSKQAIQPQWLVASVAGWILAMVTNALVFNPGGLGVPFWYVGFAVANALGGLVTGWALQKTIPRFSRRRTAALGLAWGVSGFLSLGLGLANAWKMSTSLSLHGLLGGVSTMLLMGITRAPMVQRAWLPVLWTTAWVLGGLLGRQDTEDFISIRYGLSGAVAGMLGVTFTFLWLSIVIKPPDASGDSTISHNS
jgi:hypothetical protein